MKNVLRITAAALCGIALAGCSQKEPAEVALKAADTSMNQVKAEGAKYAGEQTKGMMTSYAAAQESFNRGDYKAAMELAQGIPGKAADVMKTVAARKDELTKTWTTLATSLPPQVEQIRAKITEIAGMKKLPSDWDAAKLGAARAALADITKAWDDASDAFKAGNLIDATAKGNAVKAKVAEAMAMLGIAPVEAMPAMPAPPQTKG